MTSSRPSSRSGRAQSDASLMLLRRRCARLFTVVPARRKSSTQPLLPATVDEVPGNLRLARGRGASPNAWCRRSCARSYLFMWPWAEWWAGVAEGRATTGRQAGCCASPRWKAGHLAATDWIFESETAHRCAHCGVRRTCVDNRHKPPGTRRRNAWPKDPQLAPEGRDGGRFAPSGGRRSARGAGERRGEVVPDAHGIPGEFGRRGGLKRLRERTV